MTVAPEFRRLGLANKLMNLLEYTTIHLYNGYFVDLFVRASNEVAKGMYTKFGYSVHKRVIKYYSGDPEEDALGMLFYFDSNDTLMI